VTDAIHQPARLQAGPMLLTVKDLEAELQLGRTRTYELVRSGQLPVVRIGRSVRIPREALSCWIAEQACALTGASPPQG